MSLSEAYVQLLQPKIDAIEKVRADLTSEKISVPGVVVAGAQSSGKSSVLESLSGVNLPRGETITTRVPLLLRLECNSRVNEPYALIGSHPDLFQHGERIDNLDLIADKITEMTKELAGDGIGVSNRPIHLKIIRGNGPTLSLIDLPGIAYTSADESLQGKIQAQTTALIEKYCKDPEMIILVVVPAADDFAACEAIRIAQKYDPSGYRTLGVATKTDRVGPGTDFIPKIRGEGDHFIKLKLGFIAVRNRTPEEVAQNISLEKAKKQETNFFTTVPEVYDLEQEYWGIDQLVDRIVRIQSEKIDEFIPKVKKIITKRKMELRKEAAKFKATLESDAEKLAFFSKIVMDIILKFEKLSLGQDLPKDLDVAVAMQAFERFQIFREHLFEFDGDFLSKEYAMKLESKMRLTKGGALPNFLSHPVFQMCIHEELERFIPLCDELVDDISEMSLKALKYVIILLANDKPRFRDALLQSAYEFIEEKKELCRQHLGNSVFAEEHILTLDPNYCEMIDHLKAQAKAQAAQAANPQFQQQAPPPSSITGFLGISKQTLTEFISNFWQGDVLTQNRLEMQMSINSYCRIIANNQADSISKLVRMFLINSVYSPRQSESLSKFLFENFGTERLSNLTRQADDVMMRKKKISESLDRLEKAEKILKSIT